MNWDFILQSTVAMLVITSPPDPVKVLLFNSIAGDSRANRLRAAIKLTLMVSCILAGVALGGAQLAELIGIDLNAFSVVGGIVVAGMGFEMLYGGQVSKAQGQSSVLSAEQDGDQHSDSDSLLMPLAIPLIAGPGAIVTTVTIASSNETDGLLAAMIGVGAVALVSFVSYFWLGNLLSKLSPRTSALMLRLGGILLATVGVQMLMSGLKMYFAN